MHTNTQLCVCSTLRQASRTVTRVYDDALRPVGLRATQFQTLVELRTVGKATVTELTRLLLIDQTTLTRNLSLLVRDGLIKEMSQADGRMKAVGLTRKGDRLLQKAFPLWASAQEKMTRAIGRKTWLLLSAELRRLADIQAQG